MGDLQTTTEEQEYAETPVLTGNGSTALDHAAVPLSDGSGTLTRPQQLTKLVWPFCVHVVGCVAAMLAVWITGSLVSLLLPNEAAIVHTVERFFFLAVFFRFTYKTFLKIWNNDSHGGGHD